MSLAPTSFVPMKRYVAGFLFTPESREVLLVEKARHAWQRGLLNGVGGKIETGESVAEAMRREFREEASLDLDHWEHFATLAGPDFEVHFFRAEGDAARSAIAATDEPLHLVPVDAVVRAEIPMIPNLRWLIPMASEISRHNWPYRIQEGVDLPQF